LFSLEGKVAIITGSSRGIGLAIAQAYAEAGAKVVISSRKKDVCEVEAKAINDKYGEERAIAIAASISDKAALENLVDETRKRFGKIDILVCNAASNPYYGPLADISDELFRKTFENNVLSNHWLISMVAPEMRERKAGAIVVLSSIGGLVGSDKLGVYNITKAADFQLVRNYAVELGPYKIRVNAIAPGVIRTKFAKALFDDPAQEAAINEMTPLGRIGETEHIAGPALFLVSEAAAHVTGQTIVADGGFTIASH
jgi:NAD(P)-dependent dehydrogenase (short-subunit alcohol dehydrogenase family)